MQAHVLHALPSQLLVPNPDARYSVQRNVKEGNTYERGIRNERVRTKYLFYRSPAFL